MHVRPTFTLSRNPFCFIIILSILFLSYSITFAQQVVISPDKIKSPTFRTSDATCYGSYANTHINLGFGTSVTGTNVQDYSHCTVGGGYNNTASGFVSTVGGGSNNTAGNGISTVGGGYNNTASGYSSTVGGGYFNTAGGDYSWAGGSFMQLTDTADNTFVWGHSDTAQSITTANAFLIFPAGTAGKVGIGTKSPNELLEVGGNGRAFFGDGGGSSRKGLLIDGLEGSTAARLEAYDYGLTTGLNLVLNTYGHGNVGIGTDNPHYKLEVNGDAAKSSGGTSWIVSSDERLKDITGEYELGLDAIIKLRPITFFYKDGNPRGLPNDEENIGFIAQEVQEVFPEAVSEGADGYLDFNMHPVNVAVINAIKELKAENDDIKTENESLRTENAILKKDIEKIKAILGI